MKQPSMHPHSVLLRTPAVLSRIARGQYVPGLTNSIDGKQDVTSMLFDEDSNLLCALVPYIVIHSKASMHTMSMLGPSTGSDSERSERVVAVISPICPYRDLSAAIVKPVFVAARLASCHRQRRLGT